VILYPLNRASGRALSGHSHDYKRHGTTTLFAALDAAIGKVAAARKKRRRRVESLAFMDDRVALYPGKETMPSSTTSTPTRRTRNGSRLIPTSTSTSPRQGLP
jgi:hypothetical protein